MKYIIGSLIIGFGLAFLGLVLVIGLQIKAPDNALSYFGVAGIILSILSYPLARKLVR